MLASFTMSICCECGRSKIRGRACQRRDDREVKQLLTNLNVFNLIVATVKPNYFVKRNYKSNPIIKCNSV